MSPTTPHATGTLINLLENLDEMVYRCRVDDRRTVDFVSRGCSTLTGYDPRDFMENQKICLAELTHIEDRARVRKQLRRALDQGVSFELVYRICTSSQEQRWVRDRGHGVFSAAGSLQALEGFITDISEEINLQEQLLQCQRLKALGSLSAEVAHDFNNVLTGITGYVELMLREVQEDTTVAEDLKKIRKLTDHATNLTSQLLAFAGRQSIQLEVVQLNQLIEDFFGILRRIIGEEISLIFKPDPLLEPVQADVGRLQQVLMNLAVNAREAMSDGGSLIIETNNCDLSEPDHPDIQLPKGRYARIIVRDTGAGMDSATRKRIFEPFFTTKKKKGTGLGLSTVYGIIIQHCGHIDVWSEEGRGTRFEIYLPGVAGETQVELD